MHFSLILYICMCCACNFGICGVNSMMMLFQESGEPGKHAQLLVEKEPGQGGGAATVKPVDQNLTLAKASLLVKPCLVMMGIAHLNEKKDTRTNTLKRKIKFGNDIQ